MLNVSGVESREGLGAGVGVSGGSSCHQERMGAMLDVPRSVRSVMKPLPQPLADLDFELNGFCLNLCTGDRVFHPTLTTKILAECLTIDPGVEVLDIGCGIGPLGIFAAMKGARSVLCLDVMREACQLARQNAALNGVADRVQVVNSDLFGAVKDAQFDLAIDDISGIADEVARVSAWYPHPIPTGGPDGTEPVLEMLRSITNYLKVNGKLYLPVSSLSRHESIVNQAREVFRGNLELIVDRLIPFSPELNKHRDLLERLRQEGLIDYVTKKSRCLWNLKIYLGTKT